MRFEICSCCGDLNIVLCDDAGKPIAVGGSAPAAIAKAVKLATADPKGSYTISHEPPSAEAKLYTGSKH
jgi:hypothetical protein